MISRPHVLRNGRASMADTGVKAIVGNLFNIQSLFVQQRSDEAHDTATAVRTIMMLVDSAPTRRVLPTAFARHLSTLALHARALSVSHYLLQLRPYCICMCPARNTSGHAWLSAAVLAVLAGR